jgi:hypothetical protein
MGTAANGARPGEQRLHPPLEPRPGTGCAPPRCPFFRPATALPAPFALVIRVCPRYRADPGRGSGAVLAAMCDEHRAVFVAARPQRRHAYRPLAHRRACAGA